MEFAQDVIRYEALSPEEQAAEKERRRAPFAHEARLAAMAGKPVTDAQRAYLRQLGNQEEPADRAEASRLIDELQARREGRR